MKVKVWPVLLMSPYLKACAAPDTEKYQIIKDFVMAEKVNPLIRSDIPPFSGENHGKLISRVSSAFLGTPYLADTLIDRPDTLVANFNTMDCFTLADYVEALTHRQNERTSRHNLAEVRYTEVNVDYFSRRHQPITGADV